MRTEFMHTAASEMTASIAARGITQRANGGADQFADTLAAATSRLGTGSDSTTSSPTGPVSQYLRTAVSPEPAKTAPEAVSQRTTPQPATNPFAAAAPDYPVVNVGGSGWEVYFKTNAPGLWWQKPEARAAFAELYSEAALVTLDYTCTVPENMDPTWVTKVPVDATGRPLPKQFPHEELT